MPIRSRSIVYFLLCLLLLPASVNAQTGASAMLSVPNVDSFPRIEAYLDVHDAQGRFVRGLQAEQIRVLEDEESITVSEINELQPGVQFVVALNPGPSFAIRNSQATSRYDYLIEALGNWAKSRQGSNLDDLSLLTNGGPAISHVSNSMDWLDTLNAGQVDARSATPSLDILFRAISLAADPTVRPGMGRAVLFITPPLEGDPTLSMDNLIAQANTQSVSIFVWMISSAGGFSAMAVDQLTNLAQQTNGVLFSFTGEEPLPNPEEYVESLRHIYHLSYESGIKSGGTHQLAIRIQTEFGQIDTATRSFEINIQPPQPAFVSPPILVLRAPPPESDNQRGDEIPISSYIPTEQNLQVVFDFPDARMRSLVRTSLYVDGQLTAENTQPPFDKFIWRIDNYDTNGSHVLQVQAEDLLGLVGTSIETPVQITIESPEPNPWAAFQRNMPVLSGVAILLAGAVLLLVLVLGGRLRPRTWGMIQRRRRKSDPVTQPVPVKDESASRRVPNWVNRLQRSQPQVAPKAFAFLSHISETDYLPVSPPIPITVDETTLGSDPNQATLVLDDPSVEALHARLIRKEDGSFHLADEGSIAGTWINYTPVSQGGSRLEHGDLVHIGRTGFRFNLRQPGQVRRPVVTLKPTSQEPPQESQT